MPNDESERRVPDSGERGGLQDDSSPSPLIPPANTPRISSRADSPGPASQGAPGTHDATDLEGSTFFGGSVPVPDAEAGPLDPHAHFDPTVGFMDEQQYRAFENWKEPGQPTIERLNTVLGRVPNEHFSSEDEFSSLGSTPNTPSGYGRSPQDWQHDRQPNQEELAREVEQQSRGRKRGRSELGEDSDGDSPAEGPSSRRRRLDERSRDRSSDSRSTGLD